MSFGDLLLSILTSFYFMLSAFTHASITTLAFFFVAVAIVSFLNIFSGSSPVDPGIEVTPGAFLSNAFRLVSMPVALTLFIISAVCAYRGLIMPSSSGSRIYTNDDLLYQIHMPTNWYVRDGDPAILFDRSFDHVTTVDNTTLYSPDQQCNIVIGNGNRETAPPKDFQRDGAWSKAHHIDYYAETSPVELFKQREFAYDAPSDIAIYSVCDTFVFKKILSTLEIHRYTAP